MRFSLRSLFAFVTLISIAIVVALLLTKDYRQRMALQAELLSTGASYALVGESREIQSLVFTKPANTTDFKKYGQLGTLEFQRIAIDHDFLNTFAGLKQISTVMFQSCTIPDARDLAQLSKIGGIRSLLFWNTPIDDAAIDAIIEVPGLEIVSFRNTKVTRAGLQINFGSRDLNFASTLVPGNWNAALSSLQWRRSPVASNFNDTPPWQSPLVPLRPAHAADCDHRAVRLARLQSKRRPPAARGSASNPASRRHGCL